MESHRPGLKEAAEFLRDRLPAAPAVGIVLGSGLGGFAEALAEAVTWPYADIPNFPRVSVEGHAGRFCAGRVGSVQVVCLQGRVHLYEGRTPAEVVFGVRLFAELGCRAVLLTNAAGGIRRDLAPGTLMLIRDHLNLTGANPLCGPAHGVRFPDMTCAYDPRLAELAKRAAQLEGVALAEGVYAGLTGPSYETPAEIRMLATLGADAVGMSTVLEAIALRQLGVPVGAVSCITNPAAGITPATLDHAEVQQVAAQRGVAFGNFLQRWLQLAAELPRHE